MNSKDKHKLIEEYEDAAIALMMDEYAEADGAALLREYEEAVASGAAPEIPEELDAKIRQTIDREFALRQKAATRKRTGKYALRAAMIVVALFCVTFTAIMSVEAWRVSFLNYVIDRREEYTAFDFNLEDNDEEDEAPPDDPLAVLLDQDEFEQVAYSPGIDGLFSVMYENEKGEVVYFDMTRTAGTIKIDTEDAVVEKTQLLQYEAWLIKEEGYQLIWIDKSREIIFEFRSDALDFDTFMDMAESLASTY